MNEKETEEEGGEQNKNVKKVSYLKEQCRKFLQMI